MSHRLDPLEEPTTANRRCTRERLVSVTGGFVLNDIARDVIYGLRTLRKRPGFTLTAVVTLGLGIGVNTAVFSLINSIMLKPLPVPDAGRLVSIVAKSSDEQFMQGIPYPDYRDYREMTEVFSDAFAFQPADVQLTSDDRPERLMVTVTTGNYFTTLGLDAEIGRFYGPGEGDIGGEQVVVLDHGYWQRRFAGDPGIVGKAVSINRRPATVIGVTPASFPGTIGYVRSAAYVPFSVWSLLDPGLRDDMEDRDGFWRVVARIEDGVSRDQAQAAVTTRSAILEQEYPETHAQERAFIFPEPLTRTEPAAASFMPPVAMVFMIMVLLVLVIACANVTNLLLARAADRKREISVRSALGAGRLRIARQLLVESTMLALGGGLAGLLLATWAGKLLSSVRVASDIPLRIDAGIDLRVFGFALLIAIAAGVLAGLAPAVHAVRTNLAEALKEGGRSVAEGGGGIRLRDLLVSAQIAVSVVLLVCTALFVRSMLNVARLDLGFDQDNRLMMTVDTGLLDYGEEQARELFRELLERIEAMPGVLSVATSRMAPVGFGNASSHVYVEGRSIAVDEGDETPRAGYDFVSPGYFDTMGISILDGRAFDEGDDRNSRMVTIVNRTMADELWPGESPLGKRFSSAGPDGPFLEVVGVAETCAYVIPGEPPQTFYYRPTEQVLPKTRYLWVHTTHDPTSLVPAIRSEILSLDPDMPIFDVRTLETHVSEGKAEILFKLPARMVGVFAAIGATLAALGLYAIIAYWVSRRSHEIGVRLAMGATPARIIRLVLSKGLALGGGGVAIGLLLAWLITGRFAYLFVGVGAGDPPTYIAAACLLLVVTLTASYIPARYRAARVDPAVALRDE